MGALFEGAIGSNCLDFLALIVCIGDIFGKKEKVGELVQQEEKEIILSFLKNRY